MIFTSLKNEKIIQVNDKTRLDASKSFVSPDEAAITLMEIEPEASSGFIDVTSIGHLDWQYAVDGEKTVSIRITTDGIAQTNTFLITIVSVAVDNLFSSDADLVALEDDVLEYVRLGRNSFLDKHRIAQTIIMQQLDGENIRKEDEAPYEVADITDHDGFTEWSKYLALQLIMESLSNQVDDIFSIKAKKYIDFAKQAKNKTVLRLDSDDSGTIDLDENYRTNGFGHVGISVD